MKIEEFTQPQGNEVVVDTNIIIEIMKGNAEIKQRLESKQAIISPIVVSELYFGAQRSNDPGKNLEKITTAIRDAKLVKIDQDTAETFVLVKVDLFAKGNIISDNDIWIASSALQYQMPVYTNDKDFQKIKGLEVN